MAKVCWPYFDPKYENLSSKINPPRYLQCQLNKYYHFSHACIAYFNIYLLYDRVSVYNSTCTDSTLFKVHKCKSDEFYFSLCIVCLIELERCVLSVILRTQILKKLKNYMEFSIKSVEECVLGPRVDIFKFRCKSMLKPCHFGIFDNF